jgi:altronate hydrolase
MTINKILKINAADNIAVALQNLTKGDSFIIENQSITLKTDVEIKHKFALKTFNIGDEIIMYGDLMGKATTEIPKGSVLTTNNVKHDAHGFTTKTKNYTWTPPDVSRFQHRTFEGFHRSDGRVGTQNVWLIIPLVFCENRNVTVIHEALTKELGYAKTNNFQDLVRGLKNTEGSQLIDYESVTPLSATNKRHFPNIDGIKVLTHQGGCGGIRQDSETLCGLLAGYVNHPNVGGATVLSLGCQNAEVNTFHNELKKRNPHFDKPLVVVDQQHSGTEKQMIDAAIIETFKGLAIANNIERKPAPLSKLTIGVKCGGSDGFSGISANPAMGYTADLLVTLGGSIVLAEFPELCGQEQSLLDRCETVEIADKFAVLQGTFAMRAKAVGSGFDMNPSPGNIRDGLITDAMKSAGAAKKGGMSPVTDVLDYPEMVTKSGLNLLCTPGNDVECTTAMTGAGTNLIIFSTGLGTPTGNPVCPTLKVSTNSTLAKHMNDIIDIDTGSIITGEHTIEEMGVAMLDFCIETASGRIIPKAVQLEQDDFIPWKRGVSL